LCIVFKGLKGSNAHWPVCMCIRKNIRNYIPVPAATDLRPSLELEEFQSHYRRFLVDILIFGEFPYSYLHA